MINAINNKILIYDFAETIFFLKFGMTSLAITNTYLLFSSETVQNVKRNRF